MVGNWDLVIQAVVTISGGLAAYFLLRTKVAKETQEQTERLADVRGERVKELEAHVARLEERVADLEKEIEVLRRTNTNKIVDGVIIGIREILG